MVKNGWLCRTQWGMGIQQHHKRYSNKTSFGCWLWLDSVICLLLSDDFRRRMTDSDSGRGKRLGQLDDLNADGFLRRRHNKGRDCKRKNSRQQLDGDW